MKGSYESKAEQLRDEVQQMNPNDNEHICNILLDIIDIVNDQYSLHSKAAGLFEGINKVLANLTNTSIDDKGDQKGETFNYCNADAAYRMTIKCGGWRLPGAQEECTGCHYLLTEQVPKDTP